MLAVVPLLRPGRFRSTTGRLHEFSGADLDRAALAYRRSINEAPLVKGHPAESQSPLGSVHYLDHSEGVLYAVVNGLSDEGAGLLRSGRYKHASASFAEPYAPDNPVGHSYYLKHVGLLGAVPPGVKGLPSIEFSDASSPGATARDVFGLPPNMRARASQLHRLFRAWRYQRENPGTSFVDALHAD